MFNNNYDKGQFINQLAFFAWLMNMLFGEVGLSYYWFFGLLFLLLHVMLFLVYLRGINQTLWEYYIQYESVQKHRLAALFVLTWVDKEFYKTAKIIPLFGLISLVSYYALFR